MDRLTDEHATTDDLEKIVMEIPEQSDVYRAMVAEGQKLDTKQRHIADANLSRLQERVSHRTQSQEEQIALLKKIERMRQSLNTPEASLLQAEAPAAAVEQPEVSQPTMIPTATETPAPSEAEQGFLSRNWKRAKEYWEQSSTKEKMTHVGIGLGAAALTYGAYRLMRWLWGGTKKAAAKTKEGMGWFTKTLIGAGLLTIAGVAGYLGYKGLEKYAKEFMGNLKGATEKILAAKHAAEEQIARIDAAMQSGTDMAKAQVHALQAEKDKLVEKIGEFDRELEKRRTQESTPDAAQSAPGPQVPEQMREDAESVMKAAGVRLLARGLLAIYPASPDLGTVHEAQVNDFIKANQDRPLRDLFQCITADPAQAEAAANEVTIRPESVTVLGEDKERREAAAKYVILLCWNKRQALLASRDDLSPADIEAMTMRDFVQAFAQGAEAVAGIIETVVAAEGDPKKLKNLLNPEQLYLASGAEGELALIIDESRERLGLSEEALKNIQPFDIMKFALEQGGVSAHGFRQAHQAPAQGPDAAPAAVLASVCAAMEDETPTFMLPFFHKIFPDQNWSNSKAENMAIVRTILMDRMPVSQSVRLYLYQRMMQRGNPVGILLMQAEIFKYVTLQDERLLKDAHSQMILAMGETSLQTMAEEGDWPEMPPELIENGQRMLSFLTEKGAQAALTAAILGPREGAAWMKSAYVRYPLVATPALLFAGYVAKVYSDLSVTPADVIFRADRMKAGLAAPPLPARVLKATILRPWIASAPDARTAKELINDLDGKISKIIDLDKSLGNIMYDNFVRTFRGLDSKRAWNLFLDDLVARRAALPKGHPAIALCDEVIAKARSIVTNGGVRKAVRLAARPHMNVLLTDKLAAGINVARDVASGTAGRWGRHWMNEWRTASPGARTLYVAGVGVQALALYGDYVEIDEIQQQRDRATEYAESVIDQLRQDLERNGSQFERVSYGVYRHPASGVEVSLRGLQRQIDTHVGGAFDERELAQKLRTVNTAAGLAATILVGAKAFTGPAGLVIAGVEITIRAGINAWEQNKMRLFLHDAPPWLLAILGAQQTTGETEYDWIERASSWMLSDLWPSSSESPTDGNADKPELRKRMLYGIFVREMMQHAPEVMNECLGGMWSPDILDRFYREDFEQFVMPMFSVQLFASVHAGNISLQSALRGEVGTNALGIVGTNVTLMDIREAMRRSAVCYLQHIREKRYLEYRTLLDTVPEGDEHRASFSQIVQALGGVQVFGQQLSKVDPHVFEQNKGKTRAELALQSLLAQVRQTSGDTRAEKFLQNPELFTLTAGAVAGLSKHLDFGNRDQLYYLIDDPAVRLQLKQLAAQTLGEEVAAKRKRWNDWSLSRITHLPSAVDQLDEAFYGAPFHVANMLAGKLGEPPLHKNTSVLDVLGRSRDAVSYDAAKAYITEGLDRLCEKQAVQQDAPRHVASYEKFYGDSGPVVLIRGAHYPDRSLARRIANPNVDVSGFESGRLQAVLFEEQDLGGGHEGVLATYLFGDLASGKVSVLQRGVGTFQLSGMPEKSSIDGHARALTLQEFLVRPGAQQLLELAKRTRTERAAEQAEQKKQSAERHEAETQAQLTQWEKEAPDRAKKSAVQERLRQAAIQRAHSGNAVVFVPGSYEEDADLHSFTAKPGTFRGRFGDSDIEFADISTGLSASSADPEIEPTPFDFRVTRGGQNWNFHPTIETLRQEPSETFTREDRDLVRRVLITPMDLTGHPRANDSAYVEAVRREELDRILSMARYQGGNGWSGREYLSHLNGELWPYYRDAKNKAAFLNALLNNLLEEKVITGGVFSSPYRRMLSHMKHEW